MESYVEINVSKDGEHYFATAPRSGTLFRRVDILLTDLRRRFPEKDGFKVEATYWRCEGSTYICSYGDDE